LDRYRKIEDKKGFYNSFFALSVGFAQTFDYRRCLLFINLPISLFFRQERYVSEAYSEEPVDPDQVKRVTEFGEDYRNYIDSHSDCASSFTKRSYPIFGHSTLTVCSLYIVRDFESHFPYLPLMLMFLLDFDRPVMKAQLWIVIPNWKIFEISWKRAACNYVTRKNYSRNNPLNLHLVSRF